MNWSLAYIFFLLLNHVVEPKRPNGINFIPVEDYPDDRLTPEKISAQLGIPIRTTLSVSSFDFKPTPYRRTRFPFFEPSTYYPNTQYSRRNAESVEEDVFETKEHSIFEITRHRPTRPTTHDFLRTRSTTQPTDFVDNEEEETTRRQRKTTIQIDNEVKAPRTTATRRHTRTHHRSTTTRRTFLVDNEVSAEKSSSSIRSTDSSTQSTTEPTTQKSTTESSTDFSFKTTEAQGKIHVGDVFVVDGEAGPSKQFPFTFYPQTQVPIFTTTPESFNPWALFTTFPPNQPVSLNTPPPQTGYVDFAPNCLNNAILCREGKAFFEFLTY
jgi:hypothetical protein